MSGQLIVFYEGKEPEHFLKGIFEFPHILPVLAERSDHLKELAEERHRSVLFMSAEEARMFFNPDFTFHYSHSGGTAEEIAAKLKQDFTVMVFFGRRFGEPIALERNIDASTAAPIVVYETLKLLKGF